MDPLPASPSSPLQLLLLARFLYLQAFPLLRQEKLLVCELRARVPLPRSDASPLVQWSISMVVAA